MRPRVKRARTAVAQMNVSSGDANWSPHGRGRRSAISKSKRRKRMAMRKNRSEKGKRAEPMGSKPHSYGDSFSWSGVIWGSQKDTTASTVERRAVIEMMFRRRLIIFPWTLTKTG